MFKKLKKNKFIRTAFLTCALTAMSVSLAFAEGTTPATPDISSTMTTSFQSIVTQTLSCVAAIAPIGITIFSVFFCWKKGMGFFKSVSGKG